MLETPRADRRPIDNQACIDAMLATIRMTAGIDYLQVAGDPTGLKIAISKLSDAVVKQLPDAHLEPLIAAVLSVANAYFRAPVGIDLYQCKQSHELILLLYPASMALACPQGASLH